MSTAPLRCALPLLCVLVLSVGCSTTGDRRDGSAQAEILAANAPREGVRVFDREGRPAGWPDVVSGVSGADVIVIGETHGHTLGLAAAAALWDDVLDTHPNAALALEFFERDHQVAIDDYLAGVTDEEAFREAAGRTDGNYPPGHRVMVENAKQAGRPVFAANAPRRYVRMTTPNGYERLTTLSNEQRRLFDPPTRLSEGKYRDDFFGLMSGGGHGSAMPEGMVEKMYYSQQLWDSTMADSVVDALLAGHRPVVLVVGRFHSDFRGATVEFIEQARPDLTVKTLSMVDTGETAIADDDLGRADFVLYVGEPGGDAQQE